MGEDGKIVIGTGIDSSGIDKGINQIESELEKLRKKAEKPYKIDGATVTGDWNLSEEEQKRYDDLLNQLQQLQSEKETLLQKDREITSEIQNQTEAIQGQIDALPSEGLTKQSDLDNMAKMYSDLEALVGLYNEINNQKIISDDDLKDAEDLKRKIEDLKKEIESLSGTKLHIKGFEEATKQVNNIDISMSKILKKVAKWALAIFGVRSAYMAVRQAMSVLTQYDDQLAINLEYIRYALANAIKPIIEWIIKAVVTLLQYINYLAKAWFGKDLFASAKEFESMKNSSAGVAKNAKEIKKQLAGFDEMNILEDSSSSSSGVGAGGITSPDFNLQDFEAPKWLETVKEWGQWIIDHWEIIVGAIVAVGAALVGIKIAKWISDAKKAKNATNGLGTSFTGFFDGLGKGIEAIAILGGIALVIESITNLIDTFSDSGLSLNEVLGLMGIVLGTIIGLMGAIVLLGPKMSAGLIPFSALMAEISAILIVMSLTLPTILDACADFIESIAPSIESILETIGGLIENIIIALGDTLPPIIDSVGDIFEKVFNGIADVISTVGDTIVKIMETADKLVSNVLSSILNFINKLGPAINNFVDNAIQAATKLINFLVSGIEYLINTLVINSVNSFIKGLNKLIPGESFDLNPISNVSIPRFVPKLAAGGIINMPGRGVPIGGQAIGGEAGAEGVIPLTNAQAMEQIGESIGRYVTINLTNITQLDNRQLAREQKIINAQNDFAYNR